MPGDAIGADSTVPPPPPPPPPLPPQASAEDGVGRQFDVADTTLVYPPPPPPNRVKIALPPEVIDVAALRSAREQELRRLLDESEEFQAFLAEVRRRHNPLRERRRLLREGLKITKTISPALVKLAETVCRIVDCRLTLDLFVEPGERLAMHSARSPDGRHAYIGISSALIDRMPQREMLFLLGVQVGHLMLGHDEFPLEPILANWRGRLAPETMLRFLAWRRYAEIAADRVGMLCCQDYQIASDTYFKVTSGVTSGKLAFNLADYLQQLIDVRSLDEVDQASDDWFMSHPFSPLRIKALELFSRTDVFQRAVRQGVGVLSFAVMEERLDEFMAILHPSYVGSDEALCAAIADWVTHAALLVAYANGEVAREEVDELARLVGHDKLRDTVEHLRSIDPNHLFDLVQRRLQPLRAQLLPIQRYQIIRDLVLLAAADGTIDQHEFHALFDLAALLEVSPDFVEAIADDLGDGWMSPGPDGGAEVGDTGG